jgi:hypothetical protein
MTLPQKLGRCRSTAALDFFIKIPAAIDLSEISHTPQTSNRGVTAPS